MKIAVAGMGYVGLSLAVLFARHHTVSVMDLAEEKVKLLSQGKSPVRDPYIESYLKNGGLDLTATTDEREAYEGAQFVVIAVPTNYDAEMNSFDTTAVEAVIRTVIRYNPDAVMVIKSTVPIGYTQHVRMLFRTDNILFSPEFLREGKALYDNLYPSRIIVGTDMDSPQLMGQAKRFAALLEEGAEKPSVEVLFMGFAEAEAVKLFANTYLAMRISFFNELDTYAEIIGLDTEQIIRGVCLDPRIGMYYNNPSFGYGGYCLPKDTRQLLASYEGVPETMIQAVVEANRVREDHIAEQICRRLEQSGAVPGEKEKTVGIYRLAMKADSDNYRFSSIFSVIERLLERGLDLIIYEPIMEPDKTVSGCRHIEDLEAFKQEADLIVANRFDPCLLDVQDKVYTRDLFRRD